MKKASLFKRGMAWCCDLCAALLLSCICLKLFAPPFRWCTLTFIGCCTLCYFLLCQVIWKRSFFQLLFGLQPEGNSWMYFGWKILLGVVVPLLCFLFNPLLRQHIWNTLYGIYDFEFVCSMYDWLSENNGRLFCALCWLIPLGLAEIICFLIRKKTFAERLGKTAVMQTSGRLHPAVACALCALFLLLALCRPVQHRCVEKKYGWPAYYATPSFPSAPLIEKQRFIRDFQKNRQDPEEYLWQLFEQYDIVFLIEREHPEYTQWDFFSRFILNDTFAEKVGCVATEYGRHAQQEEVDAFMTTHYASDTDRQKAAAHIIRNSASVHPFWFGRNIYDFIIRLQEYNITHDSAHQIRWYPGGGDSDWEALDKDESVKTFYAMEKQHDSSIANTIIRYHRERMASDSSQNKMLVIVNRIHGFRDIFRYYRTCIDQVDAVFPGKTGVVYQPTSNISSLKYVLPMYQGVWTEAAAAIGGSFAVPVKGSRLEKQCYQGMQAPENVGKIRLDQLFDGLLFYKTPREYLFDEHGYPYFWADNFEDTIAMRLKAIHGSECRDFIEATKAESLKTEKEHFTIEEGYNRIYDVFFTVVYAFLLLCTLLSLLPARKEPSEIKSEGSRE